MHLMNQEAATENVRSALNKERCKSVNVIPLSCWSDVFFFLFLSLFLSSILNIWRKIINHFACSLVTQIKVDINTHTQQMHWVWKLYPLLQPHQRYGRKRQWLFTWRIDDASALPLTFLSWVLSRSIFLFFAAFTLLFTRNAEWLFSGEHQRKIGVPRHGKWLTFYDGFLLMFFTLCFLPWTTFENLVWGGFFKNSLVVTTSFFLSRIMGNYKGN